MIDLIDRQSRQAIKLFQVPQKLALPSIFDTSLSSLMMWNLQCYPTTVWMKEC